MHTTDAESRRVPVVPVSDGSLIHTASNPFCYSDSCGCHQDPELIAEVAESVQQGLLTPEEAILTIKGKIV